MSKKEERWPQNKRTNPHKIKPVSPTTKTQSNSYRNSKAINFSNSADLLEHITTQDKLDILIEDGGSTRHVLTMINANLVQIIGLLEDWLESQRNRGY